MKNKKPTLPHWLSNRPGLSLSCLLAVTSLLTPVGVRATDGTWNNATAGGLWSNTANWNSGIVADGAGATADLSTLDLLGANSVVMDAPYTLGNLIFGDTASTFYNWTLGNNGNAANVLTLVGATPTITVNNVFCTNKVVLAGADGLTVQGGSTAVSGLLLNVANTFAGDVYVKTGTGTSINSGLYLNTAGAVPAGSAIYLVCSAGNRSILYLNAAGVYNYANNLTMRPLAANSNARAEVRVPVANSTNIWNGDIFLDGVVGSTTPEVPLCDFYCDGTSSLLTLNGNISGINNFNGTMNLRGAATGVINGTVNLPNASFGKNDSGTWILNSPNNIWSNTAVKTGTLKLGANNALPINVPVTVGGGSAVAYLDLNGYSQLLSNNVIKGSANPDRITNASPTLSVLAFNNEANVACGVNVSGNISLVKTGLGALTLSAANTYTGNTVVSNGILAVSGSIARSTNIIVGPGATFAPGNLTLAAGQNLKPVDQNAFLSGTVNQGSGTLVLNLNVGTPAMTVSNGTLVLSSSGSVVINVSGTIGSGQLYQLSTSVGSGQVSGSVPVSVTLNNASGQSGSLVISNSQLYLSTSAGAFISSQTPIPNPTNYIFFAGANPTFAVTAGGLSPFTYKWFTNGVLNSAATGASMLWSNVQGSSISAYCVVTNTYGAATSAVWTASVLAVPTNPYPKLVLADKPIGYWRLNEADDGQGTYNAGVVAHDYMGGNNGTYTNTDLGMSGYNPVTDPNTTSASFGAETLTDGVAKDIGGIDFAAAAGTSKAFTIEAWVNAYEPITDSGIVAKGYGEGGEQFSLDTGGSGYGFRFFVRNAAASAVVAATSIVPRRGTWHHLVGVCDEPNALVSLYVDGKLAASASIATNAGILSATSLMSIGARYSTAAKMGANIYDKQYAGNINDVAIYNTALSSNQVQAHYFSSGVAPVITQQPVASTNVFENGPLTVSVGVNGTQPMTYSWYDMNAGSYITDQTNATLSLSSVPGNNSYYLTVANAFGTTNSSTVDVTVTSGLNATLTPNVNLTLYAGRTMTYTANAKGTYPVYYQWYTNGVAITAATNSTLTLPATVGSNSLSCVVNNSYGTMPLGPVGLVGVTAPTNLYQVTMLSNGPVAYWPLNEADNGLNNGNAGVIACDYVGGHNGTYANANLGLDGFNTNSYAALTAPLFGVFATANSLVNETDNSASGLANLSFAQPAGNNAAFSVEAWVRLNSSIQAASLVAKGNGHSEQFALDVYNGRFRFFIREASGTTHESGSSGTATVGQWYHLVGVWDGPNGAARLYVNGANVTSGTGFATGIGLFTPAVNANLPGANLVTIGARPESTTATTYGVQFPGQIANVALYNYALGASQITAVYTSGTNQPAAVVPGLLNITNLANGQVQLIWNFSGTLQSATNVAGPYSTETGATSPYTVPTTNSQKYYRVKQQ